jgi:hypothetical protein
MKNTVIAIGLAALGALSVFVAVKSSAGLSSSDINNSVVSLNPTFDSTNKTGFGISITGSTATNLNVAIDVSKNSDVGAFLIGSGDSADASVITAVFSPSIDGTLTNSALGTTWILPVTTIATAGVQVIGATNWPAASTFGMGSYRYLLLRYITNAAGGSVKFTNVSMVIPYKRSKLSGNP